MCGFLHGIQSKFGSTPKLARFVSFDGTSTSILPDAFPGPVCPCSFLSPVEFSMLQFSDVHFPAPSSVKTMYSTRRCWFIQV